MTRITKDGGAKQQFSTGARRDTQDGKPQFSKLTTSDWDEITFRYELGDLIHLDPDQPPLETGWDKDGGGKWKTLIVFWVANLLMRLLTGYPLLIHPLFINRLQGLLVRGADKYGLRNWEKGMPLSRFYDSWERHSVQVAMEDTTEDHLSATAFNVMGYMVLEHEVQQGNLPQEFGDHGALKSEK